MRARLILILLMCLTGTKLFSQKEPSIRNIDFSLVDGKLIITYDITDYKYNDKFNIIPEIYKVSGEKINARSFSGDLTGTKKVSNCRIIWDIEKDNMLLDDDIYVILKGEVFNETVMTPEETPKLTKEPVSVNKMGLKPVNRTACFFESLIFPGWGTSRLTQKNWHFVKGFLGYGAILGSYLMSRKASETYDAYDLASDSKLRDYYYDLGKKQTMIANILAGSAAVVWSVDLITVLSVKNKTIAQVSGETKIKIGYALATGNSHLITCRISF